MHAVLLILGLLACFAVLGWAAEELVVRIKRIGERLGIGVFFLGLLLGLVTSFPELAIGINGFANGAPALSIGTLLGGIPILLGLILGFSSIINRRIKTDGATAGLGLIMAYSALPVILGLDGKIGSIDGIILIVLYLVVVYALYRSHRNEHGTSVRFVPKQIVLSDLFMTAVCALAVFVVSDAIIDLTLALLRIFPVPSFLVGLVIFPIGTNLPGLLVAFHAWRRSAAELSLSYLLSSTMVDALLIGIFVFLRPTLVTVNLQYAALLVSFLGLFGCTYLFIRSGNELTRREGWGLIILYVAFVVSQLLTVVCEPAFRCIVPS